MMSKLGAAGVFLGTFLVGVAILAQFWAGNVLAKTPLDVDTVTRAAGSAEFSSAAGLEVVPIKVTGITKSNTDKSDGDVIVFTSSSCIVKDIDDPGDCVSADDPDARLVSASTDDFATDRKSAKAINDPKYLPAGTASHVGLVNKWPFGTEKKTYPYWSGTVGKAVNAVYDRTEKIDGLEVYVFDIDIPETPVEITEGLNGFYSAQTEISIEPKTGQIIDTVSHQERTLEDGSPFLTIDVKYLDSTVADNVEEAGDNADQLNLLTKVVPLVGYIGGGLLLIAGIGLVLAARRNEQADA